MNEGDGHERRGTLPFLVAQQRTVNAAVSNWEAHALSCAGKGLEEPEMPDPKERSRGGRLMFMPEGGSPRLIASALLSEVSATPQVSAG